jgi:hypothetical protein
MEFIDNQKYYTPKEVAALVGRGTKAIYDLMSIGNQLGKLPYRTISDRRLISETDLHAFRFVSSGRYGAMHSYRYTKSFEKDYTGDIVSGRKSRVVLGSPVPSKDVL